jgi:hypothetical protein
MSDKLLYQKFQKLLLYMEDFRAFVFMYSTLAASGEE